MATTLDGYLFDESPSLTSKLEDWFRGLRAMQERPSIALTIRWREADTGSSKKVAELPINDPSPAAVRNLVDKVRDVIVETAGQEPDGYVTARGVREGQHSKPDMTHSRRLRSDPVGEAGHLGALMLKELRGELAEQRAFTRELIADIREMHSVTMSAMQRKD